MHSPHALVGPVGVLVRRAEEQDVAAGGVGAVTVDVGEGLITLPFDFDIFAPW